MSIHTIWISTSNTRGLFSLHDEAGGIQSRTSVCKAKMLWPGLHLSWCSPCLDVLLATSEPWAAVVVPGMGPLLRQESWGITVHWPFSKKQELSQKSQLVSAFICQICDSGHTWLQKTLKDKITSSIFRTEFGRGRGSWTWPICSVWQRLGSSKCFCSHYSLRTLVARVNSQAQLNRGASDLSVIRSLNLVGEVWTTLW